MFYKRSHSNGLEVLVHGEAVNGEWWAVQAITCEPNGKRSTLLGLKAPTLERAKQAGDSFALISHRCDDNCQDWTQVAV